jgi:WD40 repeat protein
MKRYRVRVLTLLAAGLVWAGPMACAEGLNFGPEEFVQANGVDIQVPGYSVPSFEDWNDDGLKDLIVGEGGGSTPGKVRVYLNIGTETQPVFGDFLYAQSTSGDLVCTPKGCMGCFPRMVDWDEDGRKDLLMGRSDGTVIVFMNVGYEGMPFFNLGVDIITADGTVNVLDVGDRATPTLVDWNSDGMLDVVSGGLDGLIHIYTNCGCGGSVPPRFLHSPAAGQFAQENGHDLIVPGLRSSPVIQDLDGDGKKDILTGNTDGMILFYKNVGADSLPMFSGYSLVTSAGVPIDLPDSLRTRPFLCHWTGDPKAGDVKTDRWDLLVGYGDGKVRLYRGAPKSLAGDLDGDGDMDGDDFTIMAKALDKPVPPEGSPADLNADGVVDDIDLRLFADLWLTVHN